MDFAGVGAAVDEVVADGLRGGRGASAVAANVAEVGDAVDVYKWRG